MIVFEWIGDKYYQFIRGIRNIYYWFPIIWANDWWDHHYIEKVIIHQLQYMYENWDKSHYDGFEKDKKTIKICLETMKRINKDEYIDNMFELYEICENEKAREYSGLEYKFYWKGGREVKSNELSFPDYERQRDLETFCRCFKENLFNWWD